MLRRKGAASFCEGIFPNEQGKGGGMYFSYLCLQRVRIIRASDPFRSLAVLKCCVPSFEAAYQAAMQWLDSLRLTNSIKSSFSREAQGGETLIVKPKRGNPASGGVGTIQ